MRMIIASSILGLTLAACATPSGGIADGSAASLAAPQNKGAVTVAGLPASEALGAVDTQKLVGAAPAKVVANQPAQVAAETTQSGEAKNVISVEGVAPASVLAAIDPTKLVDANATKKGFAPEVEAVVNNSKSYTTKQLAEAQLKAVQSANPG